MRGVEVKWVLRISSSPHRLSHIVTSKALSVAGRGQVSMSVRQQFFTRDGHIYIRHSKSMQIVPVRHDTAE